MSPPNPERLPLRFKQTGIVLPIKDVIELQRLALEQGTTMTALLADGADWVLRKHGRPVSDDLGHAGRQQRGRPPRR